MYLKNEGLVAAAAKGTHVKEGTSKITHEVVDVIDVPFTFVTKCGKEIAAKIAKVGISPYYPEPLTCPICKEE